MESLLKRCGDVVFPGDVILNLADLNSLKEGYKFGPGIRKDSKFVFAYKVGVLQVNSSYAWIDSNQKRYVASKGDTVIGLIASKRLDQYKVDIASYLPANLDSLLFEGATKRHKPNLKIDDIVFAKVTVANKNMEHEIACVDDNDKSNNLGCLTGGYMFSCSLGLCRQLLQLPRCHLLQLLGKHFSFEIVVGLNGRVWINTKGIIDSIAIANAIISSEFMDDEQIVVMVKQLAESITDFKDFED